MYFGRSRLLVVPASMFTSAFIIAGLTLPLNESLAQGTSDMKKMPTMNDTKKATTASATGTITAVNAANHKITFDHGPIPAINWPAMKMEFAVASSVDLAKVKTGDKVNFTLSGSEGTYTVQTISPAP